MLYTLGITKGCTFDCSGEHHRSLERSFIIKCYTNLRLNLYLLHSLKLNYTEAMPKDDVM